VIGLQQGGTVWSPLPQAERNSAIAEAVSSRDE
jgi:hypothetical protein